VFISQLFEIRFSNYDIFVSKMFTMTPPCQSPEQGGIAVTSGFRLSNWLLNVFRDCSTGIDFDWKLG